MTFELNIETDSDAFGNDCVDKSQEIVRILNFVTEAIECGWDSHELEDNNGRIVGSSQITR